MNWKNINSLNWSGRSLSDIYFDAAPYSGMDFRYNSAGIRTYKYYYNMITEVSNTSSYVLDGSNIIKETRTGSQAATLYYYYDESGVTGFNYNGSDYYYGKNLQGDITKIYDWFGNAVVNYTYDAWGNILSTTGSLANTVGQINPFRYRSYYYDTETGWYYLNSRYYDPSVGRFINADNADTLGATPTELTDKNLFAYCDNNPVMRSDDDGEFWFALAAAFTSITPLGLLITVIVAVVVVATIAYAKHTKLSGSKKRLKNKHTTVRSGSQKSKAKLKDDWIYKGNKKGGPTDYTP